MVCKCALPMVSLCSPGWVGTHFVGLAGLSLFLSARIKGINHQFQLGPNFKFCAIFYLVQFKVLQCYDSVKFLLKYDIMATVCLFVFFR